MLIFGNVMFVGHGNRESNSGCCFVRSGSMDCNSFVLGESSNKSTGVDSSNLVCAMGTALVVESSENIGSSVNVGFEPKECLAGGWFDYIYIYIYKYIICNT